MSISLTIFQSFISNKEERITSMFSNYEKKLCADVYFSIRRIEEEYIEIQSKNTRHCWLLHKPEGSTYPVILYHKHKSNDPYFHKQCPLFTVKRAIQIIKEHDAYVLKLQKNNLYN